MVGPAQELEAFLSSSLLQILLSFLPSLSYVHQWLTWKRIRLPLSLSNLIIMCYLSSNLALPGVAKKGGEWGKLFRIRLLVTISQQLYNETLLWYLFKNSNFLPDIHWPSMKLQNVNSKVFITEWRYLDTWVLCIKLIYSLAN